MGKNIKAMLLAACICSASFSAVSVSYGTGCAYSQLIASLKGISIFKETLAIGETAQLELLWTNGAHPAVTFSSSDVRVAAVDQDGVVTGIADGTATITVSYADGKPGKSLEIAVSADAEKSIIFNTSELSLGDKLHKYDTLHYDNKSKGSCANIVNTKGGYDLVFINEKDYVLPFDAELVGIDGLTVYLAPDIDGITYLDGRTLNAGDTVDRNTHLLCYDYYIKNAGQSGRMTFPVFLPEYYGKYIGDGEIIVHAVNHDTKTIELKSVQSEPPASVPDVQITSEPYDPIIHGTEELDLTGLKLTVTEKDENGAVTALLEDAGIEEVRKKYDVKTVIAEDAAGSGIFRITVSRKHEEAGDTESFRIGYGAPVIKGDVNADGELLVSDAVLLQKWLLAVPDTRLPDWNRADLRRDGRLDAFDLTLLKRARIAQAQNTQKEKTEPAE